MLRKRNAPGVAFLHTQNANKDSELPVGPTLQVDKIPVVSRNG